MTGLVSAPQPSDSDPIDGNDMNELRMEILRLRDGMTATGAEREVLEDLVAERDRHLAELDAEVQRLEAELSRNPALRIARAVMRRVRRRTNPT